VKGMGGRLCQMQTKAGKARETTIVDDPHAEHLLVCLLVCISIQ